jgi:hypothetical protein
MTGPAHERAPGDDLLLRGVLTNHEETSCAIEPARDGTQDPTRRESPSSEKSFRRNVTDEGQKRFTDNILNGADGADVHVYIVDGGIRSTHLERWDRCGYDTEMARGLSPAGHTHAAIVGGERLASPSAPVSLSTYLRPKKGPTPCQRSSTHSSSMEQSQQACVHGCGRESQ